MEQYYLIIKTRDKTKVMKSERYESRDGLLTRALYWIEENLYGDFTMEVVSDDG